MITYQSVDWSGEDFTGAETFFFKGFTDKVRVVKGHGANEIDRIFSVERKEVATDETPKTIAQQGGNPGVGRILLDEGRERCEVAPRQGLAIHLLHYQGIGNAVATFKRLRQFGGHQPLEVIGEEAFAKIRPAAFVAQDETSGVYPGASKTLQG